MRARFPISRLLLRLLLLFVWLESRSENAELQPYSQLLIGPREQIILISFHYKRFGLQIDRLHGGAIPQRLQQR
jgi:hypothetical protein